MIRDYWKEIRNCNNNNISEEELNKFKGTRHTAILDLSNMKAYKNIYDKYQKLIKELENGKVTVGMYDFYYKRLLHYHRMGIVDYSKLIQDDLKKQNIEELPKFLKMLFSYDSEFCQSFYDLFKEILESEDLCHFYDLISRYSDISEYINDILINEENLNVVNLLMLMFCFKENNSSSVLEKIYYDEKNFYEHNEEGYESTIDGKYKNLVLSSIKKVMNDDSDKNVHYILSLFTKRIQLLLEKIDYIKEIYPNISYSEITDISVYTDILDDRDTYKYYLDLFNSIDQEKRKNLFKLIVPMEYDINLFPEYTKYEDDIFFSNILYNQLFKKLSYIKNLNKDLEYEKDRLFIKRAYGAWSIPDALKEIYPKYELEASKFNLKHHEHIPKNIEALYVFNDYFIKDIDFINKIIEKENSDEIIKNITKVKNYIYSHLPHNIDEKHINVEASRYIVEYIEEEFDINCFDVPIKSDGSGEAQVANTVTKNMDIEIVTFDTCELKAIKIIFNMLKKMIIEDNIEYLDTISQFIKQIYDEPVDDYLLDTIKNCMSNKNEYQKDYVLKP